MKESEIDEIVKDTRDLFIRVGNEAVEKLKRIECQHYKLKNEGNEGYGRCVKCGEEVRIY